VQQGSNGHLVYVIKQDGTAEVRPVMAGDYFGDVFAPKAARAER